MRLRFHALCTFLVFITVAQVKGQPITVPNSSVLNLIGETGVDASYVPLFSDFEVVDTLAGYELGRRERIVISKGSKATLRLSTDNLGQIVFYTQLYDPMTPAADLRGAISIRPFRDGKLIRKVIKMDAEGGGKEKIRYDFEVAGVDSLEIELRSPAHRFIVDKIQLGFLTVKEIENYLAIEKDLQSVSSFREGMADLLPQLKSSTTAQLDDIQRYYRVLSSIIDAGKYEQLAIKKAESYNPFQSAAFTTHFNKVLDHADRYEKRKFEQVKREVNTGNFVNVMGTLDQLVTGGKLTTVIGLVDGLFDDSMNLTIGGQKTTIRRVGDIDYFQTDKSRDRLLLDPITDAEVKDEIKRITQTNQDYKTYLELLARYAREDIKTYNKIEASRRYAEILKGNLEDATLSIMDLHSELTEDVFILPSGVNFRLAGAEVERSFAGQEFDPQSFNALRVKTIETNNLLEDLSLKIQGLISNIKSDYDILYETRPTKRTQELMGAVLMIDDGIKLEFSTKQNAIKSLYVGDGGLKASLGASVVK